MSSLVHGSLVEAVADFIAEGYDPNEITGVLSKTANITKEKNMTKKTAFCKHILRPWLREQGIHITNASKPGIDYVLCYKGAFIALAIVEDGGSVSAYQNDQCKRVTAAGGHYIVVRPSLWERTKKIILMTEGIA